MLQKLTVRTQLVGLLAGVCLLLISFAAVVWIATGSISTAASSMGQGKDVVADILPPPLYVLEAELTMLQLQDAKADEIPPLIEKLFALKKDYDERNTYWEREDLDQTVKSSLLGTQKKAADAFWQLVLGDFVSAVKEGDIARLRQIAAEAHKHYIVHRGAVDTTVKVASAYADGTLSSLTNTSAKVRWLVLTLAGGGALVAALAMILVIREIMHRLGGEPLDMQNAAQRIAEGDLTVHLRIGKDDRTSLLASIGDMQSSLHATIAQSRQAAGQLADAARSLAANAQQVSSSSARQSEATSSMAAAVEEVTVSIGHVADSASNARNLAKETGGLSSEGRSLVENTITEINRIADSVTCSSTLVVALGEQSGQISNIVNVIKEIADQTNLLALNAAIEAARAGEQGRGFAVVADEVRKLAERTTASTQEIATMISSITQGTENAVNGMDEGNAQVKEGVKMAASTGESMARIESGTQQVLTAVGDISIALREQTTASAQIADNVEEIARMTDENSAAVDRVSLAATQLEQLASTLKSSVDKFRL